VAECTWAAVISGALTSVALTSGEAALEPSISEVPASLERGRAWQAHMWAVYAPGMPTFMIEPTAIGSPAGSATTIMHVGTLTLSTCIRIWIGADAGSAAEAPRAFQARALGKLAGSSVLSASLLTGPGSGVAKPATH
jgi:hypothetical protein